jgi:hypothetical protein
MTGVAGMGRSETGIRQGAMQPYQLGDHLVALVNHESELPPVFLGTVLVMP